VTVLTKLGPALGEAVVGIAMLPVVFYQLVGGHFRQARARRRSRLSGRLPPPPPCTAAPHQHRTNAHAAPQPRAAPQHLPPPTPNPAPQVQIIWESVMVAQWLAGDREEEARWAAAADDYVI
jgi:hypothetical protein